ICVVASDHLAAGKEVLNSKWALSAPPTDTITHLGTAGGCCAAGFQPRLCQLGVKTRIGAFPADVSFHQLRTFGRMRLHASWHGGRGRPAGNAIKRATTRPRSARRNAPHTDPN